jgi:hypothetical protein
MVRFGAALCAVFAAAPAFAQTAPLAPVEQSSIAQDAFSIGVLDRESGALGDDLWRGADGASLAALLDLAPTRPASPSLGAALRRVLLSPGDPPQGATPALGGAKLKALVRSGFYEEARDVEALAVGGRNDVATLEAMATADLLSGAHDAACEKNRRISGGKGSSSLIRLRVFCYALAGELDAADLALGILRETAPLTPADEAILVPLAAGVRAAPGAAAVEASHYAALKHMGLPVTLTSDADAGLTVALARDEKAPAAARLGAARRAASMGVLSGKDLKAIYSAPLDVTTISAAGAALVDRPGDPLTDAAVYQSVRAMAAPEFVRDRARRIGEAVLATKSFDQLFALSVLYADDIKGLDGAVVGAPDAEGFALARLALGDTKGAQTWLGEARAAGLRLSPRGEEVSRLLAGGATSTGQGSLKLSPAEMATIVSAALEAAAEGVKGQSGLAALAASDAAAAGDPVAEAVVTRGLEGAGLGDLARRRAIERALAARFSAPASAQPAAPANAGMTPLAGDRPAPSPRVKPKKPQ